MKPIPYLPTRILLGAMVLPLWLIAACDRRTDRVQDDADRQQPTVVPPPIAPVPPVGAEGTTTQPRPGPLPAPPPSPAPEARAATNEPDAVGGTRSDYQPSTGPGSVNETAADE
jgi:hypothetical protein